MRHLLTHTSGLGDYPEDFSLQKNYTEDDLLKMITAQPLGFAPGEKWNYSNLGYVTLGILIHKVSGAVLRRASAKADFRSSWHEAHAHHQ